MGDSGDGRKIEVAVPRYGNLSPLDELSGAAASTTLAKSAFCKVFPGHSLRHVFFSVCSTHEGRLFYGDRGG